MCESQQPRSQDPLLLVPKSESVRESLVLGHVLQGKKECVLWAIGLDTLPKSIEVIAVKVWEKVACRASVIFFIHVFQAKRAISFPESMFPLTSIRKLRALGVTISGMCHRCRLCSETGWAVFGYFLCYFKMVAPRALLS